jgi:hypothetical protein
VNLRSILAVMLAWHVSLAPAAEPVIGMANADGSFSVDNARVFRHATLFNGSIIKTAKASSTLDLTGGARVQLAAGSKGRVFHDHLVLERGASEIRGADYLIEALALRVAPATPAASAKVARLAADRIEVAALAGAVRVTNSEGIMLASLEAGRVLEFTPQVAVAAPSTLTGLVRMVGQAYILTDEVTGVTMELRGSGIDFSQFVGKRVEASGRLVFPAPVGGPAPQALRLNTIKVLPAISAAPLPSDAKGTAGEAAGPAAAAAGHAVIAGVLITVAVGAAVGILVTREKASTISPGR